MIGKLTLSRPPHSSFTMNCITKLLFIGLILFIALSCVSARPTELKRQKRQSDQRIAELETLLALQKYGQHRMREWGRGRELAPPGYGLIDFDKIGRKKKSTRYSPGEEDERSIWISGTWIHPQPQQSHRQLDPPDTPHVQQELIDESPVGLN